MAVNNTTQSQYAMFKGVRPNSRNFKPYNPTQQSFEVWAALNDVNILSLTDKSVTFEYALIVDGKKKWAKLSGSFTNTPQEQVEQEVAAKVEAIRDEIDEVER
jgi:phosphoglucomutase